MENGDKKHIIVVPQMDSQSLEESETRKKGAEKRRELLEEQLQKIEALEKIYNGVHDDMVGLISELKKQFSADKNIDSATIEKAEKELLEFETSFTSFLEAKKAIQDELSQTMLDMIGLSGEIKEAEKRIREYKRKNFFHPPDGSNSRN